MKSAVQFAAFQAVWFAAVLGAARGDAWLGLAAFAPYLALHLGLVPAAERGRELAFVLTAGAIGTVLDTLLAAVALTRYPATEAAWPWVVAPPWIAALWLAFATLPRFSLRWLAARPALAAALGAIGGPLSYAAGVRLGAVAVGPQPLHTWLALGLAYAVATPLLVRCAPANRGSEPAAASGSSLPGR